MRYRYPAPALLALAGLLLARPATAQTAPDISPGNTYQFTKPVLVSSYRLSHPAGPPAAAAAPAYLIPAGYRFVVIATEAGGTVIHFLKFTSPAAPQKSAPCRSGPAEKREKQPRPGPLPGLHH